jgi:CheY-like chemotaxis protein
MSRFLWADDQLDVARTLSQVVEDQSIEFVQSGEDALEALRARFFDLVLLDLRMPPGEWGGLWLLEEMTRQDLFAPVVVISGEGTQTETIKALRLGAVDYVTKEKAEQELKDRIQQAILRSSAVLENIGRRPTSDLLTGPETRTVEFKETARWDVRRGTKDARMEQEITKTIAGFLNSFGGTLLIGVTNKGQAVGLRHDFSTFGTKMDPVDSFTNWLTTLLVQSVGAADAALVRIHLEETGDDLDVCRVDVPASSHPVFVTVDDDAFFVRYDNSTRRLTPRQTMDYIRDHWPGT